MTETRHSFTFTFDEAWIQAALRRDRNWAVIKLWGLYAILVPAIGFSLGWSGLMLSILGAGLIGTTALLIYVFRKAGKRVFELWHRQSPDGTVTYELDDDGYRVMLNESHSRFEWQGLRRLWCYHDVWMIEIVKNQSTFFPPGQVDAASLAFLRERCSNAGVKI